MTPANTFSGTSEKALNIALWALQVFVGLTFLATGGAKLAGPPAMVEAFELIGLGQWLRYLTGVLEVGGAIALLLPRAALFGAALLTVVMIGALLTHLMILGLSSAGLAFVLLLLSGTIAYFRRPQ